MFDICQASFQRSATEFPEVSSSGMAGETNTSVVLVWPNHTHTCDASFCVCQMSRDALCKLQFCTHACHLYMINNMGQYVIHRIMNMREEYQETGKAVCLKSAQDINASCVTQSIPGVLRGQGQKERPSKETVRQRLHGAKGVSWRQAEVTEDGNGTPRWKIACARSGRAGGANVRVLLENLLLIEKQAGS